MAFDSLAPATQRNRRWTLENFREHCGDQSFSELQREHVETHARARQAARNFLKALRAVVAVAITAGLRPDDPTTGIRVKLRASAGFKTWPEDAIAQFEARHPIGSKARLAFGLLLYTAQRRGDVIRMGRQSRSAPRLSRTGFEIGAPRLGYPEVSLFTGSGKPPVADWRRPVVVLAK